MAAVTDAVNASMISYEQSPEHTDGMESMERVSEGVAEGTYRKSTGIGL